MNDSSGQLRISIDTGSVLRAIGIIVLIYVLFLLRDLVLVVLTAVVIASAIEPGIRWFRARRIPRLPAAVFIYLLVAGVIFSVFYFLVPPLVTDVSSLLATLPQYLGSSTFFGPLGSFGDSAVGVPSEAVKNVIGNLPFNELVSTLSRYVTRIPGGVFGTVSAVFGGALSFALIVVISFYLSVQERGIDSFLKVAVPLRHQKYALSLWKRTRSKIGKWMQGQLLLVIIITVLVYLALTILGIRHAFLLAILAGIFELIPLFGPILASIPAIILGFADGGLTLALIVVGVYLIIQQFENQLIYPLVVHKVVGVPVLLVILALVIGAQLFGFLGIILAVPVATVLMELASDIEKRNNKQTVSQIEDGKE